MHTFSHWLQGKTGLSPSISCIASANHRANSASIWSDCISVYRATESCINHLRLHRRIVLQWNAFVPWPWCLDQKLFTTLAFFDIFISNVQNRFVCLFAFCFNSHFDLRSPLALSNMIFCRHIMFSLICFPINASQSIPLIGHVTKIKSGSRHNLPLSLKFAG